MQISLRLVTSCSGIQKKRMVVYEWRFVCLFVSLFHQNYIKAALALYCFFGMFVVCLVCLLFVCCCFFGMFVVFLVCLL